MSKWLWIWALALGSAAAADRSSLAGEWQLDTSHASQSAEKSQVTGLAIAQKPDAIRISQTVTAGEGKSRKEDIECNTMGKECKLHDGEVTLFYNGPMLVMIETRRGGASVLKKRFKPSDDGKTLSLEVLHLVPDGAAENYAFTRQSAPAESQ